MRTAFVSTVGVVLGLVAPPAGASEIFGGILAYGVDTPLSSDVGRAHGDGVALELGWRGERLAALRFMGRPSPHAFISAAPSGTSFAAVGLGWKLGDRMYLRPGIGLAIHDGPAFRSNGSIRTDLGSRVLFAPELSAGIRIVPRLTIEAAWVHVSHAQVFSRQNPGLDTIGIRLAWRLP